MAAHRHFFDRLAQSRGNSMDNVHRVRQHFRVRSWWQKGVARRMWTAVLMGATAIQPGRRHSLQRCFEATRSAAFHADTGRCAARFLAVYYWVFGPPLFDQRHLIETWWRYDREGPFQSPRAWAWIMVSELVGGLGEPDEVKLDVLGLVVALAASARDERELAYVGACPIEDFIRAHPADIDQIEEAARSNYHFRHALRCAWFEYFLPSASAQRLRSFGRPF